MPSDEHEQLVSVSEALRIVDEARIKNRLLFSSLDKSLGYRLAEPIRADRDDPPFDKALMDGFALRAADAADLPARLPIVGRVAAGQEASTELAAGQAMAIMTGAPIPAGADAVTPVEHTQTDSTGQTVIIERPVKVKQNIAPRGSTAGAGDVLLQTGSLIGPAAIAVAAQVGAKQVSVFHPPRVAVLATGDELAGPDEAPTGPRIRNSNSPMLVALMRAWNCMPVDLGHAPDDPQGIARIFGAALEGADILLVTGGMSMGQFDYVPRIIAELGFTARITKLNIKPGKPMMFAEGSGPFAGKYIFGLPGNPVSAFVCTVLFAGPLINRWMGGPPGVAPHARWAQARLAAPLSANGSRELYQPAQFAPADDGSPSLLPLPWKGSADLPTLAQCNALLQRPAADPPRRAGDPVRALELRWA